MGAAEATQGPKLRKPTTVQTQIYQQPSCIATNTACLIPYEAHSQPHPGGLKFKGLSRGWGRGSLSCQACTGRHLPVLFLLSLLHLLSRAPVTKDGQGWILRPLRSVLSDSSRILPLTLHGIIPVCGSGGRGMTLPCSK